MDSLLWFLQALKSPPKDPLTKQLIALVEGLEPVPGPQTIGPENYAKVSHAFFARGWEGFEEAFDTIVPRTRPRYTEVKRDLLREPIFSPKVHLRMARLVTGEATSSEIMEEVAREQASSSNKQTQ